MKYKIGDKVMHPEYGEGVISAVDDTRLRPYRVKHSNAITFYSELGIDEIIVKENKVQEITKNNIEAVLKHNGFNMDIRLWKLNTGISIGSKIDEVGYVAVSFGNPNWLQVIEAHLGKKLEPLPESNPFDVVRVGQWIRSKKTKSTYRTCDKWYKRSAADGFYYMDNSGEDRLSFDHKSWDLAQILDYNPDEEIVLAVGDEVVTKGAFARVEGFDYDKQIIQLYVNKYGYNGVFLNQIELVNGRRGKFVIPPFDFEKTLLDAGFQSDEFCIWSGSYVSPFIWVGKSNINLNGQHKIKPTPKNAQLLIEIKQKFEELEK